jgi:hypothetical protein
MDLLNQLYSLPADKLFGLTVIGALITTLGNLLATFLKDALLVRLFENWKTKRTLRSIYRKYRDPILLSSVELCDRLHEITRQTPVSFLKADLLTEQVPRMIHNRADDPYYLQYKLISTIYRLSSFLGWLELYRQEVTFLDSGKARANRNFERCRRLIQSDLADGHLNEADDWEKWTDALIFREEQRAIGEAMLQKETGVTTVIGYGTFCQRFRTVDNDNQAKWLNVASNFILDLQIDNKEKDFRYVRCLMLVNHLIELIEILDSSLVTEKYLRIREQNQKELKSYAILASNTHLQLMPYSLRSFLTSASRRG